MSRNVRRTNGADDTQTGLQSGLDSPTDDLPPDYDRPATYREVFGVAEFRAIFTASTLSWVGDYFARVAITYLIFQDTQSVLLSAAAFAISYLPWVAGGPILAAIAERYPYRSVMIFCDLVRMGLVALLAVPAVPLPVLLGLLFFSSLLTPPAQSARSALLPLILAGDRYVVGLSVQATMAQAAQVSGYAAGGTFAALVSPRAALMVDSVTFAISALLIWRGVKHRPPAMREEHRSHLFRETGEGFRVVFGDPVMRAVAFLVFALVSVVIVPEGLAAAWASELGGGQAWQAGLLMAVIPFGYVIGTLVIGRLLAPSTRLRLIRPLAVMTPLALIPALFDPPFAVVVGMGLVAGFGNAVLMPLNGLFVQVLPDAYRARAFGIMQGGMQMLHATAVLATGALSEAFPVPIVVGAWSAIGLVLIAVAAHHWPSAKIIGVGVSRTGNLDERPAERTAEATPPPQPKTGVRRRVRGRGGDQLDDAAGSTAAAHL